MKETPNPFFRAFSRVFYILAFFSILFSLLLSTLTAFAAPCHHCKQETTQQCASCKVHWYCSGKCQNAEWNDHKKSCRVWKKYSSLKGKVSIKPSTIPGANLGLFANQEIKAGEAVAHYDGSSINGIRAIFEGMGGSYAHETDSGNWVAGKTPPVAPHLAAQLANDGLITSEDIEFLRNYSCDSDSQLPEIQDFARRYTVSALTNPNVNIYISGSPLVATAIRDIQAGEEIFYGYGAGYWTGLAEEHCLRRGFLKNSILIKRATSKGVDQAAKDIADLVRIQTGSACPRVMHGSEIFPGYLDQANFTRIQRQNDDSYKLKISTLSGLYASPASFQLVFPTAYESELETLWNELRIDDVISEIKNAPETSISDGRFRWRPHRRSIELLKQIAAYQKKNGLHLSAYNIREDSTPMSLDDLITLFDEIFPNQAPPEDAE